MLSVGHIVNPVRAGAGSDLLTAQPVTFETMRRARDFSRTRVDVELMTTQYPDESDLVPAGFSSAGDLTRSALDCGPFQVPRRLPLIGEIVDRLAGSSRADVLVYTNVDIALQPYFYDTVARLVALGHDAFAVNRRTIPEGGVIPDRLPFLYARLGEPHPGWDCFVFRRELAARIGLGRILVGTGWMGRTLIANFACLAPRFTVFTDLHATFHIGNRQSWKSELLSDYLAHNRREAGMVLAELEREHGPFEPGGLPARFKSQLERQEQRARTAPRTPAALP
jgi:hypothetical protein